MTRTTPDLSRLADLDGVFVGDIEPTASTLVFRLATRNGEGLDLDMHTILRALVHCCNLGLIAPLPPHWVVTVAGAHGKAFQKDA